MTFKILLIEDEEALRMTLTERLHNEGYIVECASDGPEGFRRSIQENFDAIILDIGPPRRNGLDVCRDIRQAGVLTPILLILTERAQTIDKVLGLKIGADDYVSKPFEMMELLARIEALLRRAPSNPSRRTIHEFGSLRVDLRGTEVSRNGNTINLSAREFQLLRYFVEHAGATISRDELLKEVWGYSTETLTRTVDVHIVSLRQKLENNPKHPQMILTIPGLGYKFATQQSMSAVCQG